MDVRTASEVIATTVKSGPPIAVGGLVLFGIPLSQLVLILSAIYTTLLIVVVVRDKFYKPWRAKRAAKKKAAT